MAFGDAERIELESDTNEGASPSESIVEPSDVAGDIIG